ncbi:MAG: glycosyltransferase [Patescibacteria group bacterium]|nr:glycosyltransferase [Patescibacteria group bacterium]
MKIDFIIPVYNEEKLLKESITKLYNFLNSQNYSFFWQIIIAINGSSDNSEKIAREISGDKIKNIITKRQGKAHAIRLAIDKSSADYIIYMDVDLAVSLDNINDLLPNIYSNYDLVIGSRFLSSSKRNRSIIKELSSKIYILLSKIVLKHNFSDLQCGFKAIKRSSFDKVAELIEDRNWFFDTELLIFFQRKNFKIKEIPVDWSENRYIKRKSKIILFNDSIKFTKKLFKLKKRLKQVNPKYFYNEKP